MSRFFFTLALIAAAFTTQAQLKPVKLAKGDLEFSAGVGLISSFVAEGGRTIVPPVNLRLDYYLSDNFTLGAFGGFSSTSSGRITRPNGTIDAYENDFYIFGIRATGVSNNLNNWHIYGGLQLAYSTPTVTHTQITPEPKDGDVLSPRYSNGAQNQLLYSGFVGARRYFSPTMAGFAELGYGVSILNVGLTVKL